MHKFNSIYVTSLRKVLPLLALAGFAATSFTSCETVEGQRAMVGGAGGAIAGGILGGSRGAVAGAVIGGTLGVLSTPEYKHDYYPPRPPAGAYGYY
jgi:hypothetical protein